MNYEFNQSPALWTPNGVPKADPESNILFYDDLNRTFRSKVDQDSGRHFSATGRPLPFPLSLRQRVSVELAAKILGVSLIELAIWKDAIDRECNERDDEADAIEWAVIDDRM